MPTLSTHSSNPRSRTERGFDLIQLLIVVLIMGVIGAIAMTSVREPLEQVPAQTANSHRSGCDRNTSGEVEVI